MSFYVQVVLPLPLNQAFIYSLPQEDVHESVTGCRVLVSFGKRILTGVIIGLDEDPPPPDVKIKPVIRRLDEEPLFSPAFLSFTRSLSSYHHSSWGDLLLSSSPLSIAPQSRTRLSLSDQARERIDHKSLSVAEKDVLAYLRKKDYTALYLKRKVGKVRFARAVSDLEKKNLIRVVKEVPKQVKRKKRSRPGVPTQLEMGFLEEELREPSAEIADQIGCDIFAPFLLRGSNGSREAVYFYLIGRALDAGKNVLYLVPEISLIRRLVDRIEKIFGEDVRLFHSQLSERKREDVWKDISSGKGHIVVGPRSALFLPMRDVGMIIVDGEQDEAYYQTENPVFDSRKGAWLRAEAECSVLVYGSENPSLELYFRARRNGFLVELPEKKRRQKTIILEDRGQGKKIPGLVRDKIAVHLKRQAPVLVFLNRRGYAAYVFCPSCSHIPRCKRCQIPLSFHKSDKTLVCHYCNSTVPVLKKCPECGHDIIQKRGTGIEVIQEEMCRAFPQARIERFDSDVIRTRTERKNVLSRYEKGQIDILIGTQMLLGQREVPPTSLAVVVFPETLLTLPDFQAGRKTFQMFHDIFGFLHNREQSELVIQTALPEYFQSLQAEGFDYQGYADRDLRFRKMMGYPPFSLIVEVLLASDSLRILARECRNFVSKMKKSVNDIEILGPSLVPLMKIRGKHRAQMIIITNTPEKIQGALAQTLRGIRISKKVLVYE